MVGSFPINLEVSELKHFIPFNIDSAVFDVFDLTDHSWCLENQYRSPQPKEASQNSFIG